MVEVCMLLANECAAKEIEKSDINGIFRVHDKPDPEKVQLLLESFALYGINIDVGDEITPKFVNDTLTEYANSGNSTLINEQLLRTMQKAVYSHQNVGHFGLALENYTHFTSPIRRYADLIVHRAINAILAKDEGFYSDTKLKEISAHISTTERTAITIERKIEKLYFVEYMKDKVGEKYNCKVSGVISNGIFVQLENSPIEGMIPIKFMGSKINDNFSFDADKNCFYSKYNGELYMGSKLTVRLKKVNQRKSMIDFEVIDILRD